jgi:sugar lactone lactonase YvrE
MSIPLRAGLFGGLLTRFNLRSGLVTAAGLALFSVQATAQLTVETFAGTGNFIDAPATSVPINPRAFGIAPDGLIYVADQDRGKMIRFDPVSGIATSLFTAGGRFGFLRGAAVDFSGRLLYSVGSIYRRDFSLGFTESLAGTYSSDFGGQAIGLAVATDGTIYASVEYGSQVKAIPTQSFVVRVAGTGVSGFSGDGGLAVEAQLSDPNGIAIDAAGNVYFADQNNFRVRRVDALTNIITTVAGTDEPNYNGDGLPALATNLQRPSAVALDAAGTLYIAEELRIRRLDASTGVLTIVAGTTNWGYSGDGGPATAADFSGIEAISFDSAGNLYIADRYNSRLRRVDAVTGIVTTVLGNGEQDFCGDNGPALDACINYTTGLAIDASGNLFIAESASGRIRRVAADSGIITTFAGTGVNAGHTGDGGPATAAGFNGLGGLDFDAAGNLVIAGGFGNRVRRIDAASGIISTIAGTGNSGFAGDGGSALLARFNRAADVAVDSAGNIFVADFSNHRIRRIDAQTNVITTFAGNGSRTGPLGDGGPAGLASLGEPNDIAFDSQGDLLISDRQHYRIRKVTMATGVISTIAGTGASSPTGDNGLAINASIASPLSIHVDAAGTIYLGFIGAIRKIDSSGVITSLSGVAGQYNEVLTTDSTGRLYYADAGTALIQRVNGLPFVAADSTPPVVTSQVSGTEGNSGWYRSDVTVSWLVSDADSAIASTSGCATTSVTEETAGVTFTCSATSGGGTTTQSVTIKKDTNPPFANWGPPVPAPNANGWNNSNVSHTYSLTDTLSGVSHGVPASPVTVTNEGIGSTVQIMVVDVAGNVNFISSPGVHIDRAPPGITLLYPEANATYGAFTLTNTQYVCSDNLSTNPTCTGTAPHGTPIPASTAGAKSFTVTATDAAGNTASLTRPYSVAALQFERWIEPLRRSPILNGVTAGSLVPIRWRMLDGTGQAVINPAAFQSITVLNMTCQGPLVALNGTATGGPGLSVNPANGYFTYNWQTDASWAGTCRRVQIRLGDNSVREVVFRLQ